MHLLCKQGFVSRHLSDIMEFHGGCACHFFVFNDNYKYLTIYYLDTIFTTLKICVDLLS